MARVDQFKIEHDGKTIWINGGDRCLGRFHYKAGEVFLASGKVVTMMNDDKNAQWRAFVEAMNERYSIPLTDDLRPAGI